MKIRALSRVASLSLMFVLLLTAAHAGNMPTEYRSTVASVPLWSNFQPSGWGLGPQVDCSVRVDNQDGLIALGSYQLSTDGGATWTAESAEGLTVSLAGGGTSATLTVEDLAVPHSSTPDQNRVKFSIRDGIGLQWWSSGFSVRVDDQSPSSAVSTGGCYSTNWPGVIAGTAIDSGSGVSLVEIVLRRADGAYFNGSGWQGSQVWLAVAGTSSWSYAFSPGDGSYSVQSRSRDGVGHEQTVVGQGTFMRDTTLPQSTVETAGYFNAETWPALIAGFASDATSGVATVEITLQRGDGLYYDGASWVASVQWLPTSGTTAWSFSFAPPLDSEYTVRSRASDSCQNLQTPFGAGSFTYDASEPAAPSGLSVEPTDWTSTNAFDVSWTNPGDVSGISRAHYKWDAPPTRNSDESPGSPVEGSGISAMQGLSVPLEGSHKLYVWLEDMAGNVSYLNRAVTQDEAFRWDGTPPVTTITDLIGDSSCDGWFLSDVQASFVVLDATTEVSATYWRLDGGGWQQTTESSFTVSGEGEHVVAVYSVDILGNAEVPKLLSPAVKIDSVPPATSEPNFTGTQGGDGWYVSPVRVGLSSFDATSGVSVTHYQVNDGVWSAGDSFDLSADGEYTVSFYSVDRACNEEGVQSTADSVRIDTTAPRTAASVAGTSHAGWFLGSPVTVTLVATDSVDGIVVSGMEHIRYRVSGSSWQQQSGEMVTFAVSLPPGQLEWEYEIHYYATDAAGNSETNRTLTVALDLLAPDPIRVVPIVSPPNWSSMNCFTITWDASSNPVDLSGIGGAYYSFTTPSSPTDGTLLPGDGITAIPCVQVPDGVGDGAHNVHVWLRDKAGNTDHETRRVVTVRLDRTPPDVAPSVVGSLCDGAGWHSSCVTVTFSAEDVHSGMAGGVVSYQVNGGGWIQGSEYLQCADGVYSVNCRAVDGAGNSSAVVTVPLFKLDRTAPGSPKDARVNPVDWSDENTFTLTWLNPSELSGVAGVFYRQGSPPTSPTDGTYVDGVRSSLPIIAETEGVVPVYVWLKDKACNSDQQNRAVVELRYDGTPPTTTFALTGTLGGEGWYTSPVQVSLQGEDAASGWFSSSYRIGSGSWEAGSVFEIDVDGATGFSYYSVDVAGNVEDTGSGLVSIDREPPLSYADADGYSTTSSFTVRWEGSDRLSGIASFDVQYRSGASGAWQDWVLGAGASETSRLFSGASPGTVYYFRSRARDRAGNLEPYPDAPDVYVSVDLVQNGDFERSLGNEWEKGWLPGEAGQVRDCMPARGIVPAQGGGNTHAVSLGCPDESGSVQGQVPFGTSRVCQQLVVPGPEGMPEPVLSFRYHVFTYDVLWSERYERFYDSFGVSLDASEVFTDGNKTQAYGALVDLGWKQGLLALRPYAGQTIEACFSNATRVDTLFNTWTFVDDVRVMNLEHTVYIPAMQRKAALSGLSLSVHARPRADSGDELR